MARFYDSWLERADEPAEALRSAQCWMRDSSNEEKVEFVENDLRDRDHAKVQAMASRTVVEALRRCPPKAYDFAHPVHWAAFCYSDV